MNPSPGQSAALNESTPFGHGMRAHWHLDADCVFLNHGSFGATPREVLAEQDRWRRRMERQPIRFMVRELPGAIRAAAAELGAFLGGAGDDIAFVDNATSGVATVLHSIDWHSGDEVLVTNHAYGAVRNAVRYAARRYGVTINDVQVPFPVDDEHAIAAAVERRLGPKTRLAVLDHITSPTALVLPLARLIESCHRSGAAVLVDGAHAPGMVDVNLSSLGADWYTGNCHKWLFAPKGCGFLWTNRDLQPATHPLVTSWGMDEGYAQEFDWTGTRDPSTWLAVTAGIAFHRALGSDRVRRHNRELADQAADLLSQAWHTRRPAPSAMLGSMATVEMPGSPATGKANVEAIHDRLIDRHGIEVPIIDFAGRIWIRPSAQVYNELADYERLRDAVIQELT